ncbi:hypothetical protein Goklo_008802 [Gossypium klotzschianum]|uniref:Leucine-rich repeat-containing N-terminal plant-type domain-containing protein n=1 Tax=Gossypium klotzschianum TaxID=34286 RepID=A0A7J8V0Z6_9ROSI|nr:hypothetical protein [Gossypium klotzschianum]
MNNLLLFTLFFLFRNLNPILSLSPNGLSLLSLKLAVDLPIGHDSPFTDWSKNDATPCRWSGISCMNITGFPDPRVVGITVFGKNLRGYIPSELGTLIYLLMLNLHNNNFYGSIPGQLFNETLLHSLFLYGNNLSGSLPPLICNLPMLQNLDLSNNSLSGSLPENLKNCKQLQRLILAQNKFSGQIPGGIWPKTKNLVQLDLSSNEFNGSIPNTIEELNSLSMILNLSYNHLSADAAELAFLGLIIVYIYWKKKDLSNGCSCTGKRTFGFNIELDELLRASAYVLGKSGLGIVYKMVLENGVPVVVRRLGEGGSDQQRYRKFAAEV